MKEVKMVLVAVVLVVLSLASVGQAATTIIMDANHHNGSLTYDPTGYTWDKGYWNTYPQYIPPGWMNTNGYIYSTGYDGRGKGLIQVGTYGQAVNNTGEIVHAGKRFTVQADLGCPGANAVVQVLATQNADGTGTKFLLADVNAIGPAASGDPPNPYILYTTVGTPGLAATPRVEGYYIQVRLALYGYYDNIVVTSEDAPVTTYTYMQSVKSYISGFANPDVGFHNGYMLTDSPGLWADEDLYGNHLAVPYGWSTLDPNTDPNFTYTGVGGGGDYLFPRCGARVSGVINNTGEIVPAGHRFKIQADLGGVIGTTSQAFVYATQNIDGTGTKVLLAQVSRAGTDPNLPSAYDVTLHTVQSQAGSPTPPSVAGYYVQVLLKTAGDINDANALGYYKRIIVTSEPNPDCLYVGRVFQKGLTVTQTMYDTWVSLNKPSCWCCEAQKYGNADYTGTSIDKVDNKDLTAWKKAYGAYAGDFLYNACADFDLSGKVDNKDLTIFKQNYGTYPGTCQ